MTPEIDPQNANDEHYFEVIGSDDGRTGADMDDFIKQLEGSIDYPTLSTLNLEPDPAPQLDPTEEHEEEDDPEAPETPEAPVTPPTPTLTDPPAPTPVVGQNPDTVLVNGQEVSLADVQRLWEFDQFLRANPDTAERVQAAVKPTPVVPPAPTPPADQTLTPPEFLDLEDPAQKFMWDSYVRTQTDMAQIKQQEAQRQQVAANAKAVSDMDQALSVWKTSHPNFNEDQIISVRKHAAEMNVIGSLMATTPPVQALVRAMDLAALDDPTLRTVYLDPEQHKTQTRKQKQATTKSKLNSLGGSSGSVPRTTSAPRPMTDKEARDQFAQGLTESFQNQ